MKVAVFFRASRKFLCVCVKNELVFYGYLQIEINKYRCGLAVLTTSAASCDETVK